jgi:hypothetical protein
MREYLLAIYEGVTDVSPHAAVGGLLLGFALALVASGACTLARRRMSDPFPALCGLILLVSVSSMAFGVGHTRYALERAGYPVAAPGSRVQPPSTGLHPWRESSRPRPIRDVPPDSTALAPPRQGS